MKRLFFFLFSIVALNSFKAFSQSEYTLGRGVWSVGGIGYAFNVEAADINKDGRLDIVLGNFNETYVYFHHYKNIATTPDKIYPGRVIAICDFNGDGIKDMITMHFTAYDSTRRDYDGEFLFFYGKRNSTFLFDSIPDYKIPLPTKYPAGAHLAVGYAESGVKVGDFNGDHKMDLVIYRETLDGLGGIYIYMGREIPSNQPDYFIQNSRYEYGIGEFFGIGDLNGDGFDDLAFSSGILSSQLKRDSIDVLHIFYGGPNVDFTLGKETFLYKTLVNNVSLTATGWFRAWFSVNDINNDGIADIVVAQPRFHSQTEVHFGKKNEPIDTVQSFIFFCDPNQFRGNLIDGEAMDAGDVNGDGYNDFVLNFAYTKSFCLVLGGPNISNNNPVAFEGNGDAADGYPQKVVNIGSYNNLKTTDFVAISSAHQKDNWGTAELYIGQPVKTVTSIKDHGSLPAYTKLLNNYPNPFNPSTVISYELESKSQVSLKVYDILGNEIASLIKEQQTVGKHEVMFDAAKYHLASGVYFYELCANAIIIQKKMLYVQ